MVASRMTVRNAIMLAVMLQLVGYAVGTVLGAEEMPGRPEAPYLPDEMWMIILSYLCGSVRDLVAMSTVNRQLRPLAQKQETTHKRPIFTEQAGVREVWKQLPFGMRTSKMGCVRTVPTGHPGPETKILRVVEVGEWVVTCNFNTRFQAREQQGWTCVRTVEAGQGELYAATECDRKLVTAGYSGSIKVWEAGSWTCLQTLQGHTLTVKDLLVLDDRQLLSSSCDGTVRAWNTATWACERVVKTGHVDGAWVCSLVAHDGMVYCGGDITDPTIQVIDTATWAVVGAMRGHFHWINQLVVWKDKLISCSQDFTIRVWSTGTGRECLHTLEGHTGGVTTMAVVGDKLVTGSEDQTLRVWGMRPGTGAWECERVLDDHTGGVRALACTRDGRRLLSCDRSEHMLVWEEVE